MRADHEQLGVPLSVRSNRWCDTRPSPRSAPAAARAYRAAEQLAHLARHRGFHVLDVERGRAAAPSRSAGARPRARTRARRSHRASSFASAHPGQRRLRGLRAIETGQRAQRPLALDPSRDRAPSRTTSTGTGGLDQAHGDAAQAQGEPRRRRAGRRRSARRRAQPPARRWPRRARLRASSATLQPCSRKTAPRARAVACAARFCAYAAVQRRRRSGKLGHVQQVQVAALAPPSPPPRASRSSQPPRSPSRSIFMARLRRDAGQNALTQVCTEPARAERQARSRALRQRRRRATNSGGPAQATDPRESQRSALASGTDRELVPFERLSCRAPADRRPALRVVTAPAAKGWPSAVGCVAM